MSVCISKRAHFGHWVIASDQVFPSKVRQNSRSEDF
jgi:hypothetical protein